MRNGMSKCSIWYYCTLDRAQFPCLRVRQRTVSLLMAPENHMWLHGIHTTILLHNFLVHLVCCIVNASSGVALPNELSQTEQSKMLVSFCRFLSNTNNDEYSSRISHSTPLGAAVRVCAFHSVKRETNVSARGVSFACQLAG